MHSSRMHTAHAMTGRISWGGGCIPRTPPFATHAPFAMHTPLCHACLPFAMHAPPLPCAAPFTTHAHLCHTCPPGATTHAPQSNHTCPPPPSRRSNHACPPRSNHACPPGSTTHAPPCGLTDTCKNITFANFFCGR